MRTAKVITARNLKIFFRDKGAVFFSLLAVFIILGLYLVILGDVWTDGIAVIDDPQQLMNSWIIAGLLAVTSVTTTLGAFSVMVDDKVKKISKDFYSAPISRRAIAGGYVGSAFLVGIIMSLVTFILGEVFIVITGGEVLPLLSMIKIFGLIILTTFANTSIVFLIVTFIGSINAFSNISIVLGTLIGFLTGMYLPIGQLPEGVQFVMKCFPISYGAGLFRKVMLEEWIMTAFQDIPEQYSAQFQEEMGVVFRFGEHTITTYESIVILVITTIVFFGLSVLSLSRKKK